MWLFKIATLSTIITNGLLIPLYIMVYEMDLFPHDYIMYFMTYAAVISLALFTCLVAVQIRSGFQGTRLMIGNRHLHEGTIGFVFVFIGVVWNIWHIFDSRFYYPYSEFYLIGWYLAVGGILWIIVGAIFIGRDWEDVKKGRFFDKEDE